MSPKRIHHEGMKVMKAGKRVAIGRFFFMRFMIFMVWFSVPNQPQPYRDQYRIRAVSWVSSAVLKSSRICTEPSGSGASSGSGDI